MKQNRGLFLSPFGVVKQKKEQKKYLYQNNWLTTAQMCDKIGCTRNQFNHWKRHYNGNINMVFRRLAK